MLLFINQPLILILMKKSMKLHFISLSILCLSSFLAFTQTNQTSSINTEIKVDSIKKIEYLEVNRQTSPSNVITTVNLKENTSSTKPVQTIDESNIQLVNQAIKEQQTIIEAQNAKIEALEKMILELQKAVENK